ncbi:hypothetical protein [Paraclostridium bifermentans]|uniref:hypothetical protein n=1 Tax=Paraclostridium bifermentans TaxID=1490 RepID=UPI0022E28888|nr:hypothetical protein [Paraclostridium bifermentans]
MTSSGLKKDFNKFLEDKGLSAKEFFKCVVADDLEVFNDLVSWSEEDYKIYNDILSRAKKIKPTKDNTTTKKAVGDALEELVCFLFQKTYFFEVASNTRTKTNEIDQIIRLSKRGIQALESCNLSRDLLPIPSNLILGECKNYNHNIGVTWIGKFYSLLKNCDCNFGIIFSLKKATGNFDNWSDSYGLMRALTLLEKYKYQSDFFILEFGVDDFDRISPDVSFLDIIKAKMESIRLGTDYNNLINSYKDSMFEEKHEFISEFNKIKDQLK